MVARSGVDLRGGRVPPQPSYERSVWVRLPGGNGAFLARRKASHPPRRSGGADARQARRRSSCPVPLPSHQCCDLGSDLVRALRVSIRRAGRENSRRDATGPRTGQLTLDSGNGMAVSAKALVASSPMAPTRSGRSSRRRSATLPPRVARRGARCLGITQRSSGTSRFHEPMNERGGLGPNGSRLPGPLFGSLVNDADQGHASVGAEALGLLLDETADRR